MSDSEETDFASASEGENELQEQQQEQLLSEQSSPLSPKSPQSNSGGASDKKKTRKKKHSTNSGSENTSNTTSSKTKKNDTKTGEEGASSKQKEQLQKKQRETKQDNSNRAETETEKATVENSGETAGGGGWNSWGSFLKSAVSAVTESLQDEVDGLMTTARDLGEGLKKVTEESVDRVYETLDPEYAKHAAAQSPSTRKAASPPPDEAGEEESGDQSQSNQQDNSGGAGKVKIPTTGIVQSTETVLSAIDKTLDFTSDLLGNAVFTGYRTIEAAKIPERLGELQKNVNTRGVVDQSKQVGETLINHGLTALEAIGSVVGMQAAQTLAENHRQTAEDHHGNNQQTVRVKREPSLADHFEDNCGNAHLQALEMLGTEAEIKIAGFGEDLQNLCLSIMDNIDEELDYDNYGEDVQELDDSLLMTDEGVKQLMELLAKIKVTNGSQLQQLKSNLSQQSEMLSQNKSDIAEELQKPDVILIEYCNDILASLKSDSCVMFADFAEKSCEQMLRIAEIMLMLIAEERLERQNKQSADEEAEEVDIKAIAIRFKSFSSTLRQFTCSLLAELELLKRKVSAVANEFNELSKNQFAAEEDQLEECDKKIKKFHERVGKDASESAEFIQNAVQSAKSILKLMVLSSAKKH